jgi:tetratricopeptide (TPR) repeat protein
LIGDTMNTASRLQSGAEPGQVLIGEPTWRLVRDAVAAEPVPPLAAKGKAEPVPAWRALALGPDSWARARRIDVPMVGRDAESAALEDAYRGVVEANSCRRFTVLGVAGAGKSRLVDEFLRSLGERAEILRGRCVAYGEGITWLPLVEALRSALGLTEFPGPQEVDAAVRDAASGAGTEADLVASGLGGLFGLSGSGSAEQTAWAVRRFLEARARVRPVVLVLDDLQWAEPALLDLVDHLAERVDAPFLALCMARPELLDARPTWAASGTTSDVVYLDALPPVAADRLLAALLGGSAVPAEVRERIALAAGGNPLFTEEVVRMLVDDGRLVRAGDAWAVAGDLPTMRIPPTVSALLSSRLDRLPESERVLLEAAAIEGQSFSVAALQALLPELSHQGLSERLDSLARKELVVPERYADLGPEGYRFRHLLIRDAAYDAIPKTSRARLHLAFADWLEAAAADAIAEHHAVVGHHLAQAHRYREELGQPDDPGLRMRAGRALAHAGSRAYDELGDERTAVRLLEAAIDIAPATDETAVWDERLWNIGFIVLQRPRDARPRDVHREVYGDEVADAVAARDARLRLEFADPSAIDPVIGRRADLRALELYRVHGARHLEPEVFLRLEQGAYFEGDPEAMERWAREALRSAEELGWRDVIEWATGDLLSAVFAGPSPLSHLVSEADALLERWAGSLASRPVLVARAEALALMGDAIGARADLDKSARLREALGLPRDLNDLWAVPSFALAFGDLQAAAQACQEALALLPGEDALNRNFMLGTFARVLLELGLDAEASAAIDPLEMSAIVEQRVTNRSIRARLLARANEVEAARRAIDDATTLVAPTGLAILKADVALDRAHVLLAAGDGVAAMASAKDALHRYEAKVHIVGARAAVAVLERAAAAK